MKTVYDAFRAVIRAAREAKPGALIRYAATYANAGLGMAEGTEELRVQCLYVDGNLSAWRGEQAKQAKDIIRKAAKRA
jgi:hypothetical protein